MIDMKWSFKDRVSKSRIELPNRKKIYIFGAEKISRVRGRANALVVMDELAYWERTSLDFTAYPVPFNNEINIQYTFGYDTRVNVEVYDIKGALVRQTSVNDYIKDTTSKTTFDMSEIDNGIYFVKITTNQGVKVKKIISSGN